MRTFFLAIAISASIPVTAAATQIQGSVIGTYSQPSAGTKFGSPAYVIEWNKKFEDRQKMLRSGSIAVVPPHGFAPHTPPTAPQLQGDYFNEEASRGASHWTHM